MTATQRVRRSLQAIATIHIVLLIVIGTFSIHFAARARALKGSEDENRQNSQKIESRIQNATTIESAQREARLAWQTEQDSWNALVAVMTNFSEGMLGLLAVPLGTFVIALHALWASRDRDDNRAST